MANRIRTFDSCGFNKGRSSKFREGSRVRQTPEEDKKAYLPKRCVNNNKDEDNSLKTLDNKNHQASSQKLRQLISIFIGYLTPKSIFMPKKQLNFTEYTPGYGTKQSDGEVPAVPELWGMQSTPTLPSLPGPLSPGVVAPNMVLSMG